MNDDELIALLRAERPRRRPAELARLLASKLGTLTQGELIAWFKCAFPEIPTKTLLGLHEWRGLGTGQLTDEELDERLSPWWNPPD